VIWTMFRFVRKTVGHRIRFNRYDPLPAAVIHPRLKVDTS
jgi:hypothetical protein